MSAEKLHNLKRVNPDNEIDTIKRSNMLGERRAFNVLMEAQQCWANMDQFRRDRERNKLYTYGQQWKDIIEVDRQFMTEDDYLKEQGQVPLTNNLIRRLVRNVIGVYRSQATEPTCTARDRDEQKLAETMSTVLQCNMQVNHLQELHARTLEEFLISGLVVHRKWFGWRRDKLDCWTDAVNPNNFFIDNCMRDFRGWDVNIIGEVHDISFQTLCSQFAESEAEFRKLKDIYTFARNRHNIQTTCERFGYSRLQNYDFLFTEDPTRCRVIEVWRKESKPRYRCHDFNNGDVFKIDVEDYDELIVKVNNERRERGLRSGMGEDEIPYIKATWFIDDYWYYYYLSPMGHILKEGETPYEHKEHPYVFKAYPFIDGEVHSFVADVVDQQRYTNRLVTMYDWIIRTSAKGVLMFPEDCLPESMTMDDIADEWTHIGGVVLYKPKPGVKPPEQITGNMTNIGIGDLLNIQLKFFEDISGVNGALQGKPGYSGMSASLYNQQTQNATTSLLDLLECFAEFKKDSATKDVKNIQQFYDTKRVFNIAGKSGAQIEYDPRKIRDTEFDLSIIESTATPAYRSMANEFLMEIWKAGQISLEQLLEFGNFPFADNLLQSIQTQKEALERGEMPEGLSPEMQQQIAAQQQRAAGTQPTPPPTGGAPQQPIQ